MSTIGSRSSLSYGMGQNLSDTDRVALIRKGNALFNAGKIEDAKRCFLHTNYGDGLIRVADHYYYDLQKPAAALILYRHAGHTKKVQEICENIAAVIRTLLAEDMSSKLAVILPPETAWQEPDPGAFAGLPARPSASAGDGLPARPEPEPPESKGVSAAALNSFLSKHKVKLAGDTPKNSEK